MSKHLVSTVLAAGLFAGAAQQRSDREDEPPPPREGVAVLAPASGSDVRGVVVLKQGKDGVHLTGRITGLEPGEHGFHIHEFGDLRDPKGESAGGHFNPTGDPHGGPHDERRHAGDLGNIVATDEGEAAVDVQARGLKLHFVVGRALVVHAKADDFTSQPSGDAGDRVGIGVIGIADSKAPSSRRTSR